MKQEGKLWKLRQRLFFYPREFIGRDERTYNSCMTHAVGSSAISPFKPVKHSTAVHLLCVAMPFQESIQ
jgi:hypothetical protein